MFLKAILPYIIAMAISSGIMWLAMDVVHENEILTISNNHSKAKEEAIKEATAKGALALKETEISRDNYFTKLIEAKHEIDSLTDRLKSGASRLRIDARCPPGGVHASIPDSVRNPSASPGSEREPRRTDTGGEFGEYAILGPDAERAYLKHKADIRLYQAAYKRCLDYAILADRICHKGR